MEKNFELLRPFDLEAAKAGGLLTSKRSYVFDGKPVWKYVAGPDAGGRILVQIINNGHFADLSSPESFSMAPLCWVEGRPVYPEDTLYYREDAPAKGRFVAKRQHELEGSVYGHSFFSNGFNCIDDGFEKLALLTWTEPNPILCEIEGRPVRKGDRLWSTFLNDWFVVGGAYGLGERALEKMLTAPGISASAATYVTSCSWNRPPRKVRRQGWVNVYPKSKHHRGSAIALSGMSIYATKEIADQEATEERIACIQIEWTEEVSE